MKYRYYITNPTKCISVECSCSVRGLSMEWMFSDFPVLVEWPSSDSKSFGDHWTVIRGSLDEHWTVTRQTFEGQSTLGGIGGLAYHIPGLEILEAIFLPFCVNALLQTEHEYGRSLVWTLRCILRFAIVKNLAGQSSHKNGLIPGRKQSILARIMIKCV